MSFFETAGNATVIVHDDGPILTTDPWIAGDAYFGSWGRDFEFMPEQMQAVQNAKYHWFSHGHPDHLNVTSLPMLTKGQFLISDHYGNRIRRDLCAAGYQVRVLPDRTWVELSKGIRVYSVANQNQDSMLLIDVNGRLIVNLNDSTDYGESLRVRRMARHFKEVYLLQLHSWGAADMLNLFDPSGRKLIAVEQKRRVIAPRMQRSALVMGANKIIPFSSFQWFQREDSAWANPLVPELVDYRTDALPNGPEILPAFVRVDCENDEITPINPPRAPRIVRPPEEFGDSWSDSLTSEDKIKIRHYFTAHESLRKHFGFIEVSAGGSGVTVDLNPDKRDVGISFECPRNSLMACIEAELFDDLLIGNYMRTTLHNVSDLYPDFTPYVAKYADNGGAKTQRELDTYFRHYYMRDPVVHTLKHLRDAHEMVVRKFIPEDSGIFRLVKRSYYAYTTHRVNQAHRRTG
ncbi:MAG: hypothetical protein WA459_25500 [Stellaceae bacterium]